MFCTSQRQRASVVCNANVVGLTVVGVVSRDCTISTCILLITWCICGNKSRNLQRSMCSTATLTKSKEKTGTWAQVFPTEQLSETKSALFVKKLLAISVSNITYLRAIFPEHAFGDRALEDLNLKILKDDSSCPGACQVIKWVKGCFDALDKKYLKMLMIGIYVNPDDPDTVIESYTFKFSYTEEGGIDIYRNNKKISSAYSTTETKKATMRLLRTIVVLTQSLQSLPDDVMMTMKLLYYDDVTPSDYEPPGFQAAETDNFKFEDEPMGIKVGEVATPFHMVRLQIKTDGRQFQQPEDEPQTNVDGQQISDEGLDNEEENMDVTGDWHENIANACVSSDVALSHQAGGKQVIIEPTEADSAPSQTPAKPGCDDQAVSQLGSSQRSNVDEGWEEDLGVRCGCGCNEDDGLMILCANCKHWQHGICYLILTEDEAPERHICEICGNPDDPTLHATDLHLCHLTEVAVQATCLWRRALMACTEMSRVLAPSFARRLGVEMTVAQGLLNRLEKEGYIKQPAKGKRLGKLVNKEKLRNEAFRKYLKKTSNKHQIPLQAEDEGDSMKDAVSGKIDDAEAVSQKSQNKARRVVDNVIGQLTTRAECLDISDNRPKLPTKVDKSCLNKAEPVEQSTRKRRDKKRVKAVADREEHQFEVADSQEMSQSQDYDKDCSRRKRRKSSVASRAILV
ncbi:hypothetical protein LSAT2_001501 [Lamellibrachia satsuma]|nr:hypothetical protein LSAT2_001501 [Lamellibrachia satsuma]